MFSLTQAIILHENTSERVVEARPGKRLSKVIRDAGLPLGYSCGGRGICVACIVQTQGELSVITEREASLLKSSDPAPYGWSNRVACLARIRGEVHVRTTYW